MNIFAAKERLPISLGIKRNANKPQGLVDGQVYNGTVTSKEKGRIGIQLEDGFAFEAKADGIDKNIGDKVKLMAAKSESGSFTLRILDFNWQKNTDGALSPCQTKDLFKQNGFITEESIHEKGLNSAEADAEEKARMAIARVQSKLAYATDNLTMHAVNELLANGVSVAKLNLSMLNSVLKQVKESPQAISEADMDKIIDAYMKEHGIDSEDSEQKAKFIKVLSESTLPVNGGNMEFMEKCLKKYADTDVLSDGAIAQLIKIGGEITLSGLYSANHIEALKNGKADMEILNKELPRLLDNMDIPDDPQTRENAALLFEYDLAITAENMEKVRYLKNLSAEGEDVVIKAAANAIKEGTKPESIVLTDFTDKASLINSYKEIMDFLPNVTNRQVAYINSISIPVTLYNLRNISVPEGFTPDNQNGDSRYMLVQIQHKLTNEAAQRLIGKGINIDTMPINKALNEIRSAEMECYAASLEEMGAEPRVQNISALRDIMDVIRNLKFMVPSAYRAVAEGSIRFSVAEIEDERKLALVDAEGSKSAFMDAENSSKLAENDYASSRRVNAILERSEKLMAEPDSYYGDSLDKANESIERFVRSIGLSADEKNMKNASILVNSGMDLSRENMLKISIIDLKVTKVYDELHPRVAAHMVKSGFNPLNSHIDSVIDYIDKYNAEYGENPKDSVAEAIYQMDKEGRLEESERQSLIAIYKMLDKIEKDSFTSLGLNLRAGHMPTLRSLMNMADLKTDVSREVSESGYFESRFGGMGKALNRLSANSVSHEEEYAKLVMKSFAGKINRNNLEKLKEDPALMDKPLEELVDYILEEAENTARIAHEAETLAAFNDMKSLLGQKHDLFAFFESIGIPATIGNIKTYLSLKGPGYFAGTITDIADEINGNANEYSVELENLDTGAPNQPNEAIQEQCEKLEQAVLDSGKANMLKEVRLLQNAVKVQNAIAKRQNNFKIPVDIGGKAGQLNMYMPKGYAPGDSQINLAVSINVGEAQVSAMCLLEGNSAKITLDIEGVTTKSKRDIEKKLNAALKSFGLKGSVAGYGEMQSFSGEFALLPELGRDHKESMFNIGKAMMKFADNIIDNSELKNVI